MSGWCLCRGVQHSLCFKLFCCNHFQIRLLWQCILLSKGVCIYLTTANIYFSKGQLNLCLNLRWVKGHCNYLLYYLCQIWITMNTAMRCPLLWNKLKETQLLNPASIFYGTNQCCRTLSRFSSGLWLTESAWG